MIKVWDTGDIRWTDISAYFEKQSNEDRIEGLQKAFDLRGLEVDIEMFKDFSAIKYIRNSYIHSNWTETQRGYVIARNFPGNVMNFEPSHFARMQAVYAHIMNKLGMARALNSILQNP